MSKLLQSISSSGARFGSSLDSSVSRVSRRKGFARLGSDVNVESTTPSFTFRVPRKLRILGLGSRRASYTSQGINKLHLSRSGEESSSSTFLGRLRGVYERVMLKAATKSTETSAIPVAKTSRAPPALASALSSWGLGSVVGSRQGIKVSDLDPGFKMTASEKKYVEHLKRTASSGRF